MEDVEELIAEADKRGIGLMFDMVFNHVSTEHEWFRKAMDGDPYYMYEFQWDELTDYVYEEGIVLGYLFTQVGDIETMTPLPYVLHRQDAKGNQWTETYTYDVSPGYVAFYATYNDFKVQEKPATMDFRVSILW